MFLEIEIYILCLPLAGQQSPEWFDMWPRPSSSGRSCKFDEKFDEYFTRNFFKDSATKPPPLQCYRVVAVVVVYVCVVAAGVGTMGGGCFDGGWARRLYGLVGTWAGARRRRGSGGGEWSDGEESMCRAMWSLRWVHGDGRECGCMGICRRRCSGDG